MVAWCRQFSCEAEETPFRRDGGALEMGEDSGLWKVDEAAEYLGIRPKTLYEWVRKERVPHRKLGFNVRFDPAELREWADAQSRGPGDREGDDIDELDRLREAAGEAVRCLRELEREVATHLSYPRREEVNGAADRLEEALGRFGST